MSLRIDTTIGNKRPSGRLIGMLVDLVNNTNAIFDSVGEIRAQAHSEGFDDFETDLLLKTYLVKGLGKNKARYLLNEKPRLEKEKQKKLTKNLAKIGENDDNNVPNIPPPDYNIVVPNQVLDEVTQEIQEIQPKQEQEASSFVELKPDYGLEESRVELEDTKKQLAREREDKKQLEEKYKQLETKIRDSPASNLPFVQGNKLRTKIVVNQVFREILVLKGARVIYANIVIDISQNKYLGLKSL
jgi:hypothetical protein